MSYITLQTYYKMDISNSVPAQYILDNLDNLDNLNISNNIQKPKIIGQVITRTILGSITILDAFIIIPESDDKKDEKDKKDKKIIKHFVDLDFFKTMVSIQPPVKTVEPNQVAQPPVKPVEIKLYDYLKNHLYHEISFEGITYNIYNKKYYDEI